MEQIRQTLMRSVDWRGYSRTQCDLRRCASTRDMLHVMQLRFPGEWPVPPHDDMPNDDYTVLRHLNTLPFRFRVRAVWDLYAYMLTTLQLPAHMRLVGAPTVTASDESVIAYVEHVCTALADRLEQRIAEIRKDPPDTRKTDKIKTLQKYTDDLRAPHLCRSLRGTLACAANALYMSVSALPGGRMLADEEDEQKRKDR
jgi:hypothetical protein